MGDAAERIVYDDQYVIVKIGAKVVRHGRYVTFQLAGGGRAQDAALLH